MQDYSVEHSSVECRWIFNRMLPSLPGPGTPAFATLVKGLQKFGIDPSGITVDAPSSRMSEVVLGIVLMDKRVAVRIAASSFDLYVSPLYFGDEAALMEIGQLVLNAVREIDTEADQAEARIRTSSHFSLIDADAAKFLDYHLKLTAPNQALIPDAIAYKVTAPAETHASGLRVVFSPSIAYSNAIFVEVVADYSKALNIEHLATWVTADFEGIMKLVSLQEAEANQ